ncbi:hypothetical protein Droror1_Dr00019975, partial [Drosera rotundifolia]
SLNVLDLYNNNLPGPLPISVVNMTGLRHLYLGGNYLEMRKEYGQIGSLEYLDVSGNELARRILVEIRNLSEGWRFNAANCELS